MVSANVKPFAVEQVSHSSTLSFLLLYHVVTRFEDSTYATVHTTSGSLSGIVHHIVG